MASTYAALKTAISAELDAIQTAYQTAIGSMAYEITNGGKIVSGSLDSVVDTAKASILAAIDASEEALCGTGGEIDDLAAANPEA